MPVFIGLSGFGLPGFVLAGFVLTRRSVDGRPTLLRRGLESRVPVWLGLRS